MAHIKNSITLDWNEIWAWDLHYCTVFIEVAKNLVTLNVIGHGKVPYQKPQLKFMVHGVYPHIAQCISAMCGATQREQSIVPYSRLFSRGVYFMNFEIAVVYGINFRIPTYLA